MARCNDGWARDWTDALEGLGNTRTALPSVVEPEAGDAAAWLQDGFDMTRIAPFHAPHCSIKEQDQWTAVLEGRQMSPLQAHPALKPVADNTSQPTLNHHPDTDCTDVSSNVVSGAAAFYLGVDQTQPQARNVDIAAHPGTSASPQRRTPFPTVTSTVPATKPAAEAPAPTSPATVEEIALPAAAQGGSKHTAKSQHDPNERTSLLLRSSKYLEPDGEGLGHRVFAAIEIGSACTRAVIHDGRAEVARLTYDTMLGQSAPTSATSAPALSSSPSSLSSPQLAAAAASPAAAGDLPSEGVARTLEALRGIAAALRQEAAEEGGYGQRRRVVVMRMVATAAVRCASEGSRAALAAAAERLMSCPLEVLSGEQEGRLAWLGVAGGMLHLGTSTAARLSRSPTAIWAAPTAASGSAPSRMLVVDLGGRSTEFTCGTRGSVLLDAVSIPLGCVSLYETATAAAATAAAAGSPCRVLNGPLQGATGAVAALPGADVPPLNGPTTAARDRAAVAGAFCGPGSGACGGGDGGDTAGGSGVSATGASSGGGVGVVGEGWEPDGACGGAATRETGAAGGAGVTERRRSGGVAASGDWRALSLEALEACVALAEELVVHHCGCKDWMPRRGGETPAAAAAAVPSLGCNAAQAAARPAAQPAATTAAAAATADAADAAATVDVIFTGGTVTTLAALQLQLPYYDRARVHGSTLTAAQLRALMARLAEPAGAAEALASYGWLTEARCRTLAAGCAGLLGVMAAMVLEAVVVSDADLLDGLLAEVLEGSCDG